RGFLTDAGAVAGIGDCRDKQSCQSISESRISSFSTATPFCNGHSGIAHEERLSHGQTPVSAAEELLEIVMRRYERTSTLLTSNRPVDDWGKLLGDSAAVTAMLGRLLHHGHVLKCGPRSWRTKIDLPPHEVAG